MCIQYINLLSYFGNDHTVMVDGYAYHNGKQRVQTVYGNEYSANTILYFKRSVLHMKYPSGI